MKAITKNGQPLPIKAISPNSKVYDVKAISLDKDGKLMHIKALPQASK